MVELPDVGAVFSADHRYRYWLGRVVPHATLVSVLGGPQPRRVVFVCGNPSTAGMTENDNTIRKLFGYAQRWGFARLDVVNMFGYRSTDPDALTEILALGHDIVGPENDAHVRAAVQRADRVIVAHGGGTPRRLKKTRPAELLALLWAACRGRGWVPEYLELAKDGTPKHPLYLKGALEPQPLRDPLTISV